uniref:Transmembrane protein n=1 Tax=Trypanosoma vivax (strain Y486) TaxID=1055687 RepID=G0UAC9_TRYVY|nr:hypothetical protein TVY486_1102470 [Trypanosoma vivax Y486]
MFDSVQVRPTSFTPSPLSFVFTPPLTSFTCSEEKCVPSRAADLHLVERARCRLGVRTHHSCKTKKGNPCVSLPVVYSAYSICTTYLVASFFHYFIFSFSRGLRERNELIL